MYWRFFFLKSRFVIKIATTDQQLWGKLNQRVVGKADRAQPCTRSHFILGSNLLSINRNKLTYFHCLLSTSSATIKLCGFPPPLINRTKNFPLHFQLVSLLPPKVLLEDWWLMMAMLTKGICLRNSNHKWWGPSNHPIQSPLTALQRPERHKMTLEELGRAPMN